MDGFLKFLKAFNDALTFVLLLMTGVIISLLGALLILSLIN